MDIILTSPDQLKELIIQVFKELAPQFHSKEVQEKEPKYLTRKEVKELFGISFPTLSDHTKKGNLKAYNIGRRVLYKQSELESALVPFHKILKGRASRPAV